MVVIIILLSAFVGPEISFGSVLICCSLEDFKSIILLVRADFGEIFFFSFFSCLSFNV